MSKRAALRLASSLICSLPIAVLVLVVIGAAGLAFIHERGWRLLSVQTASMVPVIRPGDAILVMPARAAVQPGEIVSYRSPRDPNLIISHRLTRIDKQTGWLTTAGDALNSPDPPFPSSLLVGQVTAVAPHLGTLLNAVRQPLGLLIAVYVPGVAVMISEAKRLAHVYTRPLYSVRLEA